MELAEIMISYKPRKSSLVSLNNSQQIYELILGHWNKDTLELQEEMKVILLNRSNQLLGIYDLSKGGISGTFVDVKLLLSVALKCIASHIIVVHNHPSGNLKPSKADIDITNKLKKATRQVDLLLLDHLIVTKEGYYSFADHGQL
ncbi:JAB domain-containing protein [Flagellimonas marinaquae]|uniref:JAB domain-containing protein n=1 Tax=Flagellimonas marinaquae TaxID=254955 RepID=UPI000F8CE8E6|nr:JAB domain-containing protein [Allomuricauda aquimarina]